MPACFKVEKIIEFLFVFESFGSPSCGRPDSVFRMLVLNLLHSIILFDVMKKLLEMNLVDLFFKTLKNNSSFRNA